MADRPTILVTEPLSEEAIVWLGERAEVVCAGPSEQAFEAAIQQAAGLIVRTYTTVDGSLLDRGPNLKVVGRAGTGLDNIDQAACGERGIAVVHTPHANRQAVVEYVASVLTSLLRPLPPVVQGGLSPDAWSAARRDSLVPRQMSECTLGILGLGSIGRRVAEVASAIGFQVQFHDLLDVAVADRYGAEPVSMQQLFRTSDIVTVHVDGRAENRHLLNQEVLESMPETAVLVNTSRGFVLDEQSLAAVIDARPRMRAILDVHEHEPIPADAPLLHRPNVTLLPHAASRTEAAQRAMSWVVRDVWATLES